MKMMIFCYEHLNVEYDRSCNKGTLVKLLNLETNKELMFNSLTKLYKYLELSNVVLNYDNGVCFYKNYKIEKIKVK